MARVGGMPLPTITDDSVLGESVIQKSLRFRSGGSTYFLFPSGSSPIIPTTDGTISMISFTVHRQGVVGLATQLLAGASVNFS